MSYCPLMMAANGLSLGDGPDARAMNKSRECRADCAWRIGDDCAMVVLARAAVKTACRGCNLDSYERENCEHCGNYRNTIQCAKSEDLDEEPRA